MVKLRYVELEPDKIFNWLDPKNITAWNAYPDLHDTWWEPETVALREKFGAMWTVEFDKITGHFSKLEESVLKDGIQQPISCVSGIDNIGYFNVPHNMFPPNLRNEKLLHTRVFGGSRLTMAKKYNIRVGCAIHDYNNSFENEPEIQHTNFNEWFSNDYSLVAGIPYIRLRKHSHICEEKYNGMTHDTKLAQCAASTITKELINV